MDGRKQNALVLLTNAAKKLADQNVKLFLVGGVVRDQLMGLPVRDLDIVVTGARPDQIDWKKFHLKVTDAPHGATFASWTLRAPDGTHIDLAEPRDQGHFGSWDILRDLMARDLTINAFARDLATGQLIHPDGSLRDLREGRISAQRGTIQADPIRALRALRFAARFGFEVVAQTAGEIRDVKKRLYAEPQERIAAEVNKALMVDDGAKAAKFLDLLREHNLLAIVLPELQPMIGQQQNQYHTLDVWGHTLKVVAHTPPDLVTRWAAVLHDVAKPHTAKLKEDGVNFTFLGHEEEGANLVPTILNKFRQGDLDSDGVNDVQKLVREHLTPVANVNPRVLRRLANRLGVKDDLTLLHKFIDLKAADTAGGKNSQTDVESVLAVKELVVDLFQQPVHSLKFLAINGNDLIEIGFRPGKEIGNTLHNLLGLVMDNPNLNTKDKLLAIAKEV